MSYSVILYLYWMWYIHSFWYVHVRVFSTKECYDHQVHQVKMFRVSWTLYIIRNSLESDTQLVNFIGKICSKTQLNFFHRVIGFVLHAYPLLPLPTWICIKLIPTVKCHVATYYATAHKCMYVLVHCDATKPIFLFHTMQIMCD